VALVATLMAGWLYQQFLTMADGLWYSTGHDRNAHLWLGMSLAIDIRTLDFGHFLKDLHGARIWGPLHPLLLGLIMAVGGLDERLGVLPSLACWVGTAVFGFLAARRTVAKGGNLAGTIAALFVVASPAYRAFGTDIMLESMGAFLSLGALYFYLRTCQDRTPGAAACFGLMLSLLFFDKCNYWLLMILALAAATLVHRPFEISSTLLVALREWDWKPWARAQLRHPLHYVLALLTAVLIATLFYPGDFQVGSLHLSTRSPHNLLSVIVIVLFVRLLPWWWRKGRGLIARLGVPGRQLVYWHVWPVGVWFLWPQRLGNCIIYLTRHHGQGEDTAHGLFRGLPYYWSCLGDHYHAATWLPWLVVALLFVAVICCRRLRPGSTLLFWFLLVSGVLTMSHPTLRSRFLHSWLATTWVIAGAGAALLIYNRLTGGETARNVNKNPDLRTGLAAAVVMVLVFFQLQGIRHVGRSPEGGPHGHDHRVLEMVTPYLSQIEKAQQPVIVSNTPLKFLAAWTYLKHTKRHDLMETDIRGFLQGSEHNQQAFDDWLRTTRCDALVFIHVPPGTLFDECATVTTYNSLPAYLARQKVFEPAQTWDQFPREYGGVTATLWKRAGS